MCGSISIFLSLNSDGYCQKCADRIAAEIAAEKKRVEAEIAAEKKRVEADELKRAIAYHVELISVYNKLPKHFKFSISSDPNDIQNDITIFDELLEMLPKYTYYARFNDAFVSFVIDAEVGSSVVKYKQHKVFDMGIIFTDYKTGEIEVRQYMDDFIKTIQKLRKDYADVLFNTNSFYEKMRHLRIAPIRIDATGKSSRNPMSSFPDVAIANLTKRTPDSITKDFIVIDVETTGLKPSLNEILQISAIRFEGGYPCECFNTFVKPVNGLKAAAQEINGIQEADVNEAPEIQQVIGAFEDFVGKTLPLVGHNVLFDLKFLHTNGSSIAAQRRKFFDTCSLAKKAYPDASGYSLDSLCSDQLRIARKDGHNSLSDCLATGELFQDIRRTIEYS
jgi:DNA polymerase III epsilon subunit-like protein